jgi:MFS superfamily sulfate permease-like transporter
VQKLGRLRREEEIGIWVIDPDFTTEGLNSIWAPQFVEGTSAAHPLVVKLEGDISFTMANTFKDRMSSIAREYQSEDEVRALVVDMSGVVRIDYSGVLALEAVLQIFKPGCVHREATGGEIRTVKGESAALKKGDNYTQNVRGIRVHLAHVMPGPLAVLSSAGLLHGNVSRGQWKVELHATVDMAVQSLEGDFAAVKAK